MEKMAVPSNYLYEYIKDKALHHMTDLNHVVEILESKFANDREEIENILKDAIDSNNPSKIYVIDTKYGYDGTISKMYKALKPNK
jgi:hypothetical protein